MTIAEFKAWLEGFEAAMSGAPTPEQWAAIKAKIATVRGDGQPKVTYRLPAGTPASPWREPNVFYNDDRTVPLRAH